MGDCYRPFVTPSINCQGCVSNDTLPSINQRYGGRSAGQGLITKIQGVPRESDGIVGNIINSRDEPPNCMGCNQSNPGLAAIKCDYLSEDINSDAVKLRLRAELPHLTRKQIAQFQLPFYETLCHDLLENGYHYAFTELFSIHTTQLEQRRSAGAESVLWTIPPISEQPDKIHILRDYLAKAEAAGRRRDEHSTFNCYVKLANYFRTYLDDVWLAEHFYGYALTVAERICDDDGLKLARAFHYNGIVKEMQGDLKLACRHFIAFYKATRDKDWINESKTLLSKCAERCLVRCYLDLIDAEPKEYLCERIAIATKAHDIATASGEWALAAPVCYVMGKLLEEAKRPEEAITFYRGYFNMAKEAKDLKSLGGACEALAKLYRCQGKPDEVIRFLKIFADVCETNCDWVQLCKACHLMGLAYDYTGNFLEAQKYMTKAYGMPSFVNAPDMSLFGSIPEYSRIMIGVTRAHVMNAVFNDTVITETPQALIREVDWKGNPSLEDQLFCGKPKTSESLADLEPVRNVLLYAQDPAWYTLRMF